MWSLFDAVPMILTSGGTSSIGDTLATSLGTVATDALDAIGGVLPVALPVLGAIVVISVGIRIFRKVSGR